jgi:uncharacterized protein (TIGR02270 family)
MKQIIPDVIEEHAEEAAFLWQQREAAIRAPDYDLSDIVDADERLEAHLDGLRIGGKSSFEISKELGWDLPGEYFTAMTIAIRLANSDYVSQVLDAAEGDEEAIRGIVSSFGWVSPRKLRGLVKVLLQSESSFRKLIGIGACAIHRAPANSQLEHALHQTDEALLARSLKACGELGLVSALPLVQRHLEHANDACRFQAARSAVFLGDRSALKILTLFARVDNPFRRKALEVVVRAMDPAVANGWIRNLAADRSQLRYALIASGIHGDPAYLPVLMRQFENEEVARVAGEAFEMITGLNIFRESLEVIPEESPPAEKDPDADEEALTENPPDDEDEDEELGEDEGLVIPDPAKMTPWFEKNKDRFQAGQRYLCGVPVSVENCRNVLLTGLQRQRQAAKPAPGAKNNSNNSSRENSST